MDKKDFGRARILFFSVLLVFFVLLELNVMLNSSGDSNYLVALTFLIIVTSYLLVLTILQKRQQEQMEREEQIQKILELVKETDVTSMDTIPRDAIPMPSAPTVSVKEFPEMDEIIAKMNKMGNGLLVKSVDEQKKHAKIIVERSKDNTVALVRLDIETKEKLSRIEEQLERIEAQLKKRPLEKEPQREVEPEAEPEEEFLSDMDLMAEPPTETEPAEELLSDMDLVAEQPTEPEEKPPMPDLSDPNKVMSPDDIAALLANM